MSFPNMSYLAGFRRHVIDFVESPISNGGMWEGKESMPSKTVNTCFLLLHFFIDEAKLHKIHHFSIVMKKKVNKLYFKIDFGYSHVFIMQNAVTIAVIYLFIK